MQMTPVVIEWYQERLDLSRGSLKHKNYVFLLLVTDTLLTSDLSDGQALDLLETVVDGQALILNKPVGNRIWKRQNPVAFIDLKKTRPVWTGFKIAVRHNLLTHYKTRLYTPYKKGNNKYYCIIINKDNQPWWLGGRVHG